MATSGPSRETPLPPREFRPRHPRRRMPSNAMTACETMEHADVKGGAGGEPTLEARSPALLDAASAGELQTPGRTTAPA